MPSASGQPATPPLAAPYAVSFSAGDLRQLRHAVAGWAARAGLHGQRAAGFVLAVHEIAANAVRHGSPAARIALHTAGAIARAEIHDSGHWPPGPEPAAAPGGLGMGLRVARQICDQVTIHRSPSGSTVTLQMNLPAPDPARNTDPRTTERR